jgi:hypothetical protein
MVNRLPVPWDVPGNVASRITFHSRSISRGYIYWASVVARERQESQRTPNSSLSHEYTILRRLVSSQEWVTSFDASTLRRHGAACLSNQRVVSDTI